MGKARGNKFAKGKSKKDTWKKLQHPDLEDFLQDQRQDERLGIKEKTDDQLFIIDQDGSDAFLKAPSTKPRITRQRRVRNKEGPLVDLDGLRCFKNLKPDSVVKDPVIKRNRTKLPAEKKSKDQILKDEVRRYKQEQVKIQAADSTTSETEIVDPWSAPNPKKIESVLGNEWLTDETKRNLLRNRSLHKIKKQPTQLKAIEPPHPGLSVNPSFLDHQDILKQVVEITKSEIKKEQKLIRATAVPRTIKGENSEDDVDIKEETEIKTEPESDGEEDSKQGILLPNRKTRQQRRKARELNEQQRQQMERKEKLRQESDVYRIKKLKKQITEAETESKRKLQKKVDEKIQHEKFGQLRLGKHKYKPLKPEPLLSDEMGGSLLTDAKNSIADLTLERFKSLQKRNLIEPRVKQRMTRKYKLKRYQRPSEKMEWEVTGMWNGEKLLNPGDRRRRGGRGPPPSKRRRR